MLLIDTAGWINVFRDKTGQHKQRLAALIGEQTVVLSRFTQMELLQGCRDDKEWSLLRGYLNEQ